MAGVGDLLAAVCAPGCPEQQLLRAAASYGPAVGEQRRPELGALSIAGAAIVSVLLEEVEGAALAVDDDATQRRARNAQTRGSDAGGGARGDCGAVRRGGIRGAARGAAAAGGDQRDRQGRGDGNDCDLALHGSSFSVRFGCSFGGAPRTEAPQ